MLVFDFNRHGLARGDVRNRCRKKIRALLVDEAGFPAGLFCLLIFLFRLLLFPDLSFDESLSDMQPHAIDRRVVRQREHINTFHPLLPVVAKRLFDGDAGNKTIGLYFYVGIELRCDDITLLHSEQQSTALKLVRGSNDVCIGRRDRRPQAQKKQNDRYRVSEFEIIAWTPHRASPFD